MKKIILLAFSLVSLTSLFAQTPTVLGTYLPVANTEIKQVWNVNPPISQMPIPSYSTDSNDQAQIWDYSQSFNTVSVGDTFFLRSKAINHPDVVNLDGMPISQYFPEATHASFVRSPFAVADSLWSFFKVDSTGMYGVGHFALRAPITNPSITFEDTTITMLDEEIIISSRVSYLDHLKDSSKTEVHFLLGGSPAKHIQTSYVEYDVRGHGQLITPYATYDDVLLGTANIVRFDEVYVDFGSGYSPVPDATLSQYNLNPFSDPALIRRHYFLRNNTFASSLLMQINTDTSLTNVIYGWYTLPSEVGNINGTVINSNDSSLINFGKVLLYREGGNFVKDDVLDSSEITNGAYEFTEIPYGQYRLLARPDRTVYPNSFSSYYEENPDFQDSLQGTSWTDCDLLVSVGDTADVNIYVRNNDFTPSSIPNQLEGSLLGFTLNKIGGNDPIPGIDIIIKKNPGSKPIISTQTDSNGDFSFANLPDGGYKIWVDMPGLDLPLNATYDFEVSKGQFSKCEFDFTADLDTVTKTSANANCATWTLLLEQSNDDKDVLLISPNPFKDNSRISLNLEESKDVSISIYDVTGKLVESIVQSKLLIGNNSFDINNLYNAGIYLVRANIGGKEVTKRLIKL
jgi:hypothetical protein